MVAAHKPRLAVFLTAVSFVLTACSKVPDERVISVRIDPRAPDGEAWDVFGGPPDPYVIVDGKTYRGYACDNSFKCSFRVKGARWYRIEVWDRDEVRDNLAGKAWCWAGHECQAGSATVKVTD